MKNRISPNEMDALHLEYSVTADTRIPLDTTKLRMLARSNPDQICYPVIRTGGRGIVPAAAFSGFAPDRKKD